MKTIKKLSAIALALVMIITIAPAVSPVKAGDSSDFKSITKGINSDGTVSVGKPVSLKASDLESMSGVSDGFAERAKTKAAYLEIAAYSTKYDYNSRTSTFKVYYKDGEFKFYPRKADKENYYLIYVIDSQGTNVNDSNWYQVKGGTISILAGPSISGVYGSKTFLKKNFTVNFSGSFKFKVNEESTEYYEDTIIVKLYRNGKLYATKTTDDLEVVFSSVPVSYGKDDSFKVALFVNIGVEIAGPEQSFKTRSQSIPKTTAYATKLSKKKAYVRWNKIGGVTGYYIYNGNKKVKTVSAKAKTCIVSGKKAGSGRYKVCPYVKVGKAIYKSASNVAKPAKNEIKYSRNLKVSAYTYGTCPFVITKISLSGKTYKVTGYAINNRIFKMAKYKKLSVGLTIDGKKAFKKTYKNKKVNAKDSKKKKITLKIKGKANMDLAHGSRSLSVSQTPVWVNAFNKAIK